MKTYVPKHFVVSTKTGHIIRNRLVLVSLAISATHSALAPAAGDFDHGNC